jgi:hypothetical protein
MRSPGVGGSEVLRETTRKKIKKSTLANKDFLDTTALIRSIQRAEGNSDCFRRAQVGCEQIDCAWRKYCLEEGQASSSTRHSSKKEKATETE